MRVRPATLGDIEGIERVAEAAWHEAHAPIAGVEVVETFLAEYYDSTRLFERITSSDWLVFVADDDGVAGFAAAQPSDRGPSTYGLANLYVAPDRWHEGIGSRLLDRTERAVADRGGSRLRLAVMADNDRAIAFYEAVGFERVEADHDHELDVERYFYAKDI